MKNILLVLLVCFSAIMPINVQAQSWDWVIGSSNLAELPQMKLISREDGFYLINPSGYHLFSTAYPAEYNYPDVEYLKFHSDSRVSCSHQIRSLFNKNAYIIDDTLHFTSFVYNYQWQGSLYNESVSFKMVDSCKVVSVDNDTLSMPEDTKVDPQGNKYFSISIDYGKILDTVLHPGHRAVGRFNRDGSLKWRKIFKGNDNNYYSDHTILDRKGNFVFIITRGNRNTIYKTTPEGQLTDSFSIDSLMWQNDIAIDHNNNIYIAGSSQMPVTINSQIIAWNNTKPYGIIIKLNEKLNYVRHWQIDNVSGGAIYNIECDKYNNLYASGNVPLNKTDTTVFITGGDKFSISKSKTDFILKFNADGKLVWHDFLVSNKTEQYFWPFSMSDDCGNVYFGWYIEGLGDGYREYEVDVNLGSFHIDRDDWKGNILAKLNPDSLRFEVERGCGYLRIVNKSDRKAYTHFEWVLPGGMVQSGDELLFSDNSLGNEIYLGLRGYKAGGCTNTFTNKVDLRGMKPEIDIEPKTTTLCLSNLMKFTNNSTGVIGELFEWDFGDGLPPAHGASPLHKYHKTGKYRVTVTYDKDACATAYKRIFDIEVFPDPDPEFIYSAPEGCAPLEIILRPSDNDTANLVSMYELGDGRLAHGHSLTALYPEPGQYTLMHTVTSTTSGCWEKYGITVKALPDSLPKCKSNGNTGTGTQVYIPNAFFPDGDNLNDNFSISASLLENFYIEIFNTLGVCIFSSPLPDFQWDGTVDGKLLPAGSYLYRIKAKTTTGEPFHRTGAIHLVR